MKLNLKLLKMSNRRLSCFAVSPTEEETTLTAEQLEILELWHLCGFNVDVKTFWQIWRLTELGIPAEMIVDLLNDISKNFVGRKVLKRQQTV